MNDHLSLSAVSAGSAASRLPDASAGPESEPRVVVVEDEVDARDTLRSILEGNGYAVQTAATPAQAIEVIESFRPVCVMLDLGLPDKASGLQLAKQLLARFGSTLVIVVVTGHTGRDAFEEAMAAGVDYVLTKPLDLAKLNAIVQPVR
jgi:DNA-binding response OmpR family regulator